MYGHALSTPKIMKAIPSFVVNVGSVTMGGSPTRPLFMEQVCLTCALLSGIVLSPFVGFVRSYSFRIILWLIFGMDR